jgi:GNAT superfamily N-acetyltransferase
MITANTDQNGEGRDYRRGEFLISTDRSRLNLDVVHAFLVQCYWAAGIPKEIVARSIQHSLCFGLYCRARQIGFARVISDYATYAYVGDVFVLDEYRGQGLGKWLMQCIMGHPMLQDLRRWTLLTRDAHGLYEHFGFRPLKAPERWMEIHNPKIYVRSTAQEQQA